jgi:hypothetical protein
VEKREWKYILGVRMRSSTQTKSDDPDDPSPLEVKEVWVEDQRRYAVCLDEDQATKDRFDREALAPHYRKRLVNGTSR